MLLTFSRASLKQYVDIAKALEQTYAFENITHVAHSEHCEICFAGPAAGGNMMLIIVMKPGDLTRWDTGEYKYPCGDEWEYSVGDKPARGAWDADQFSLATSTSFF